MFNRRMLITGLLGGAATAARCCTLGDPADGEVRFIFSEYELDYARR